jgi:methionyl-tRNA formyltransferase
MRVVFAGTPEFAQCALAQLHAAAFTLPLVLTQPDRPAGRGMKLQPSAVKAFALQHGIAVAQPRSLRLDGKYPGDAQLACQSLEAARPDVIVVAAYGLILPQWVLDLPRLGCLNIHASLLPRWRGAASSPSTSPPTTPPPRCTNAWPRWADA